MSFAHLCRAIPGVVLAVQWRPRRGPRCLRIRSHAVAVFWCVPEALRRARACSWSRAMCARKGGGDRCFLFKILLACGLVGSGDAPEALLLGVFQWFPDQTPVPADMGRQLPFFPSLLSVLSSLSPLCFSFLVFFSVSHLCFYIFSCFLFLLSLCLILLLRLSWPSRPLRPEVGGGMSLEEEPINYSATKTWKDISLHCAVENGGGKDTFCAT